MTCRDDEDLKFPRVGASFPPRRPPRSATTTSSSSFLARLVRNSGVRRHELFTYHISHPSFFRRLLLPNDPSLSLFHPLPSQFPSQAAARPDGPSEIDQEILFFFYLSFSFYPVQTVLLINLKDHLAKNYEPREVGKSFLVIRLWGNVITMIETQWPLAQKVKKPGPHI